MTVPININKQLHIFYPSSDGKRMADNTRQWNWITFIKNGLEETTINQNTFVAGDLLWYPVEGNNKIRVAPDVMVAIGRPKGDRNSYLQWREDNITPQIVFEILSPSNTKTEMKKKLHFYEGYGVQEYYVYNPDTNHLEIYNRTGSKLIRINVKDWISPLLKIRFIWTNETLELYQPNGFPFLSYAESMEKTKIAAAGETKAKAGEAKANKKSCITSCKIKSIRY